MGSGSSVRGELLPPDIAELVDVIGKIKSAIAISDCNVVKGEQVKMFKSHSTIVTVLTSRTKQQLNKIISTTDIKPNDLQKLGGGNYGKFLSLLPIDRPSIDQQLIELATKGLGCDENILCLVFCTLNARELRHQCELYQSIQKISLQEKILGKTKKNSPFQRFLMRILSCDRSNGSDVDATEASRIAYTINNAGAGEVDKIFDMLCPCSRQQCLMITDECKKQFNVSLVDMIKKKVGGIGGKCLIYWVIPKMEALCSLLKEHSKNSDILLMELAKLDKLTISRIEDTYQVLFQASLRDMVKGALSGNFERAVLGWIGNPSPDGGLEEKISEFLASKDDEGIMMDDLLNDEASLQQIRDFLQAELQILHTNGYGKDLDVHLHYDPHANATLVPTTSFIQSLGSTDSLETVDLNELGPSSTSQREKVFQGKYELVKDYLALLFGEFDVDDSGFLDSQEFDSFLKKLHFEDFGYTPDEIQAMLCFCDWDHSGTISFEEAANELADMIIQGIENNQKEVDQVVPQLIQQEKQRLGDVKERQRKKNKGKKARKSCPSVSKISFDTTIPEDEEHVPEIEISTDLLQYLRDSFEAYDTLHRGYLDTNEFWQLLTTMNLDLGDEDIIELQVRILLYCWDLI